MTESEERREYREKCRNYGAEGTCYSRSGWTCYYDNGFSIHARQVCTENANCARMKCYDKQHGL